MLTHTGKLNFSPVGVCVLPIPPANAARSVSYPDYIFEIMDSAGLCYSREGHVELAARLSALGLLITVGEFVLDVSLASALAEWIENGGAWISIGGVCGQEALLGVRAEAPTFVAFGASIGSLGEGYLSLNEIGHPALGHLEIPLHYFNGIPLQSAGATVLAGSLDAHGRTSNRVILAEQSVGFGKTMVIAPDLTGSVVMIQQGRGAVTRDGIPAADGTAPTCDNVLKSDDGAVLDWILDRQPVEGIPGLSAFLQPVADQWRELLLRCIFHLALSQRIELPLLWLYPDSLPAIAHLSLDTDNNDPAQAQAMFDLLQTENIPATWCTIMPGLPKKMMRAIDAAGHELAMHYDAISDHTRWDAAQFAEQWRGLVELFDGKTPVTNKNHYLRWEGDCELWHWCERHGIKLDQSKGASKTGEAGFNFGTCRPYFPVDPAGRLINVLELPTPTQDLEIFAPKELLTSLLRSVSRHHGILHLLFHPAHIEKPGVADAIQLAVCSAQKAGMQWWTAARINSWERSRRAVRWSDYARLDGGASVSVTAEASLKGATLLWLTTEQSANGPASNRWGFHFRQQIVDLKAGQPFQTSSAEVIS